MLCTYPTIMFKYCFIHRRCLFVFSRLIFWILLTRLLLDFGVLPIDVLCIIGSLHVGNWYSFMHAISIALLHVH